LGSNLTILALSCACVAAAASSVAAIAVQIDRFMIVTSMCANPLTSLV
jgi:hypothetical protein